MFRWQFWKNVFYILLFGIVLLVFSYLLFRTYPFFKMFFHFLWQLFLPFLIAGFLAYLIYPFIIFLHRHHIHKGLAVLLIYILFFGGAGYLFYHVYPLMIHQLKDLTESFPEFIKLYDDIIYKLYDFTSFLPETVHDRLDELLLNIESSLDELLAKLMNGFMHIFDMILMLSVIPVLVFYFIKDHQQMKNFFGKFIRVKDRVRVKRMFLAMDESLGGYIRGQVLVCLFVTIATLLIFKWLGVPYALLLAILFGVTNLIPYFGPIIAAVPAVLLAYTISGKLVLYVIIAVILIQVVEGNLLSPYIVGKSVNIHPIAIIFVLLLGGGLFGIIGMIFAVPVLTIIKVIIIHLPNLAPSR